MEPLGTEMRSYGMATRGEAGSRKGRALKRRAKERQGKVTQGVAKEWQCAVRLGLAKAWHRLDWLWKSGARQRKAVAEYGNDGR